MSYILEAPEYVIFLLLIFVLGYRYNVVRGVVLLLTVALLFFFREWTPPATPPDPRILYSPCDGIISDIKHHDNGTTQVCIFLNVHNIHAQYAPFDCVVTSVTHRAGSFHPAYLMEKSQYNERMEYVLENTHFGTVGVTQIAGQIARSCVAFVTEGQQLECFTPLGMIKLGSRCDIYVRSGTASEKIRMGERIHIGDPLFYAA